MLYARFIICLGFGLFGLSLFLKTIFDSLFLEWDMVAEIRRTLHEPSTRRGRYVTIGMERRSRLSTRNSGASVMSTAPTTVSRIPTAVIRRELREPVVLPAR
ncbi:MAG: hypothetical protein WCU88_02590 [Elusimicrobiota bacterium]|jgi:hypothetical protein